MSLRINFNSAAVSAHRTLGNTSDAMSKSIERLSSGFRINSAGDDPAGLVISEKLRAQVSGLGQAIKNAGDATNMVKTAEGALGEVNNLLRSMRDLAVHAANTGATDDASRQADQSQITNAINSLNKIASETQFGGRKLLDGSAGVKTFINGSSVMSGDFSFAGKIQNGADVKVSVTTAAEKATLSSSATFTALAAATASSTATYASVGVALTSNGTISIGSTNITYSTASGSTVSSVLASINAVKATTGVEASFDSTTGKIKLTSTSVGSAVSFSATDTGDTFDAGGDTLTGTGTDSGTFATSNGSMYVNGVKIDYASGDNAETFVNNVNAKSDLTGATASYNATTGAIDIKSNSYGSSATVNITNGSAFLGGASNASDSGVDAVAVVTQTVGGSTTNISDNAWSAGKGLTLQDSQGNTIYLTEAGGSATSDASSQFTVEKNTLTFQLGAYADQTRQVNIGAVFAHNMGNGAVADANVATIDVTSNAQDAIKVLDKAISDVTNIRASMGATQKNVLESSTNSLSVAKENISASESTIRDTDMADEMVQFTKLQMLNQAGVSMMAQANQAPRQLLSLLG